MKDPFSIFLFAVFISIVLSFTIFRPMGKSEAHSILTQTGTVITSDSTFVYFTTQPMLTLQIEALGIMSEEYKEVFITFND